MKLSLLAVLGGIAVVYATHRPVVRSFNLAPDINRAAEPHGGVVARANQIVAGGEGCIELPDGQVQCGTSQSGGVVEVSGQAADPQPGVHSAAAGDRRSEDADSVDKRDEEEVAATVIVKAPVMEIRGEETKDESTCCDFYLDVIKRDEEETSPPVIEAPVVENRDTECFYPCCCSPYTPLFQQCIVHCEAKRDVSDEVVAPVEKREEGATAVAAPLLERADESDDDSTCCDFYLDAPSS